MRWPKSASDWLSLWSCRLVRDGAKKITLAVGDGANDVSMIQVSRSPTRSLGFRVFKHVLGPEEAGLV